MIRCIIIDDDEMARLHLKRLCQRIDNIDIISVFEDALSAYHFLEDNQVDLIFLDIEMPGFSGIELVQQLADPPGVIFITSKESYAATAFDFIETVVDYLIKPVGLARLSKAVKRVDVKRKKRSDMKLTSKRTNRQREQLISNDKDTNHIFVKTDRKYVRIQLDNLLYVETMGDYSIFKTTEKQYIVHATLKSINERLYHSNFFKVHRSFIVNLNKIKDIEDNNLLIEGKIIPISRTQRPELMELIMPL